MKNLLNNENEKFIEPNELSILICQICYKTNSTGNV